MELTLPELLHCAACLKAYHPLESSLEVDHAIEGSWPAITIYNGNALCRHHLGAAVAGDEG